MRRTPVLFWSSLAALTLACGIFDAGSDLKHAVATQGCGPADGPTTVILLANDPIEGLEASFPYVRLTIGQPVTAIAGRTWPISDALEEASAVYVTAFGQGQSASSGRVTVTSVDETNKVEGSVELRFPGRAVMTGFSAPWIESTILCG